MDGLDDFDAIFAFKPDLEYDPQVVDQILRNRRALENELFIDRLLKAFGIDKASQQYPPRSNDDLRILYERIVNSTSPDHHKQSLIYYILRDIPHSSRPAEKFAKASYLPAKYKTFIDGIWCLDRQRFEKALDFLTEPSLIPTFPEDILYTLCRHAPENDVTLPLAYFHTVSPCITSSKVLEELFSVLCRASVTEAFYFSRRQGEFVHHNLFERLITFVLADSTGDIRAMRGVELINLPLNEEEESWFEEYLKDGKGRTLLGANDTIVMRGLATGRLNTIMEYGENMSGHKIDNVNWTTLRDSIQQGSRLLSRPTASKMP